MAENTVRPTMPLPSQRSVTIWRSVADERTDTPTEGDETSTPEFISVPEWARRLGISHESGYKAARIGQIPGCFNVGRLYRVNWTVFVAATSSMHSRTANDG
jgi:hypothetical protein